MNDKNYISYHIEAGLILFDKHTEPQLVFSKELHVREPPRGIPQNLKGKGAGRTTCCCCFSTCGLGPIMSMQANVSCL